VAVDAATGDVYALDDGPNKRVEVFAPQPSCHFEATTAFTGSETPAGAFAEEDVGLAVDNSSGSSSGDVYVADTGNSVVDKFSATGKYIAQLSVATPSGVAVDSEGNVYVTSFADKEVHEFNSEGTPLRQIGGALLTGTLFGVAVDAQGNLYVVNLGASLVKLTLNKGAVEREAVIDSAQPQAVATDTHGRVYTIDAAGGVHVAIHTTAGKEVEVFGGGEIGAALGLAFGPVGSGGGIFVGDVVHNQVHVYEQGTVAVLPEPPEVTGCAAGEATRSGATVACTINPNGSTTAWHLNYSEAGSATVVEVSGGNVTTTELAQSVLTGLATGTEYKYKLVATNANGTAEGEGSFKTLAAVTAVSQCQAAHIEGTHVTLEGTLQPEALLTHWHFDYGLTTGYGASSASEQTEAAGTVHATAAVTELEGNASYHCRLVGTNAFGTTDGKDGSFSTPLVEPLVNQAPPSATVTRTTAVLRGVVNPENSPTHYRFQYVEAGKYQLGSMNPYRQGGETTLASAGSQFGQISVGPQAIEGLRPGTEYHYRLVAANQANPPETTTDGEDHTFVTSAVEQPLVTIGGASEIVATAATLSATVDPQGLPTAYEFEVSTSGGMGVAHAYGSAGEGTEAEPVLARIEGLEPGTTYTFRASVRNADGGGTSAPQTFTTVGVASPITEPLTLPLLAIPAFTFPREAPPAKPTQAQLLAKALKACHKKHVRRHRISCERNAHKRYGPRASRG
jgi:hypothetical protein